uniref:Uncharacterized protein n=1 Tax=Plectus sambesii TaxID=2011161 RepID=A0A914V783_9BILA
MRAEERLNHAFTLAESELNVPRLIEPKDFGSEHLDQKSVMTYLLTLLQALPHDRSALVGGGDEAPPSAADAGETVAQPKTPPSQSSDASFKVERSRKSSSSSQKSGAGKSRSKKEMLKEYQARLEEVLAWLLEAEDQLQSMLPVCEADVEIVKRQFKDHEDFMVSLTQSQDSVGLVLHRGQILEQSDKLNTEEAASIHNQITLVNERWESVRQGAMER